MLAWDAVQDSSPTSKVRNRYLYHALVCVVGFVFALFIVVWPIRGVIALVAFGAAFLLLLHPLWLLLILSVVIAIPKQGVLAGVSFNAADGLLVSWCLMWPLMMKLRVGDISGRWSPPPLLLFSLPFLGSVLISQAVSINPDASLKQVVRLVEWFIVLPIILTVFRPTERFCTFAGLVMMLVPCFFALDGLFEYLNEGRRLTGLLGISVPIPEGDPNQIRYTYDMSGRAGSSFGGPQNLAMYLVLTIGFPIAFLIRPPRPWMRSLAFVCLLVILGGLIVTESRGGLAATGVMVVVVALTLRRSLLLPFVLLTLFVILSVIVGIGLWPSWDGTISGLVPGRPEAVLDRLIIWNVALGVIANNPLFGVGLNNFRDAFSAVDPWMYVELGYASIHSHNTYLEVLTGSGLLGLLAYLLFIFLSARLLLQRWSVDKNSALTLAAIGSFSGYLTFAMVDMILVQNMHLLLVLIISLGLSDPEASFLGVTPKPLERAL